MKIKEISIDIFSGVLSFSQMVVDGLSSALEMKNFTPKLWVKYAAFSASIVEGEIYRKNIIEGFTRCNLSKESLLKFLVIQKFETELATNEQYEKELRENIHCFFTKIENEKTEHKLDKEEQGELGKCITLLEDNIPLNNEMLNRFISCFMKLRNERDGISGFANFNLAQVPIFELLKKRIEILKKKREKSDCAFLTSYQANKNFLKNAKNLKLSESEVREIKDRLKCLKKTLVDCVAYPENWQFLHIPTEDPSLIEANEENYVSISYVKDTQKKITPVINPHLIMKLQKELTSAKLKLGLLRFSMLFSVTAGVAIGIVTFYTFPAVLTELGLAVLLPALWPLAILAAISYGMLIYNTLADLIINETLSKWWKNLKKEIEQDHGKLHFVKYILLIIGKMLSQFFFKLINWLKPQKQEGWFKYSLRIVLSLLVISFGVIAALATGYTVFSQLHEYVSVVVCIITALPLLLSDFIFTLKNSFESIGLLTAISFANLRDPVSKALKNLKAQMLTENSFQLALHLMRVPLKILLEVFKLAIFICHIFFSSVASDRLFNMPYWLTVMFSCGSELLTDICPLFGKNKGHGHHDHDHGGFIGLVAKIIFIVPATLLGVLNCIFSQLNHLFSNSDRKVLHLGQAIKQEYEQFAIFHFHTKKEQEIQSINRGQVKVVRQLPREIVLQKSIKICDKQINRLEHGFFNSKLLQEKKEVFKQYKTELVKSYQQGSSLPFLTPEKRKKLGEHRIFNRAKETKSIRQFNKLQRWFNINTDHNISIAQCNGQTNNGYAAIPH